MSAPRGSAAALPDLDAVGVVMLVGWTGVGGAQRQALTLSTHLRPLGVRPVVVTMRTADLPAHEVIGGIDVHRVGRRPGGLPRPLAFLAGFLLWLRRHRRAVDVVHAHNLPAALTAGLLQPLFRTPIVVKLPNAVGISQFGQRRLGGLRWRVLSRTISRFVAVNVEIEHELLARGIPARRIIRIPNGVEPPAAGSAAETEAIRRGLELDPAAPVVVYVGRLVPGKGLAWLLRVWRDVVREEPAARLLVVGDGPDRDGLRELANGLDVAGSVVFLGHRNDVETLLAAADVLVLPSRSEGMSNAVLEGMAHGLAVLATDIAGNRALVESGEDGLLVAFENDPELRAGLLTLLRDGGLRRRLGQAAAAKAAASFSIRAVASAYRELYRDLVAEGTWRAPRTASVSSPAA